MGTLETLYSGFLCVALAVILIGFVWAHVTYKKESEDIKFFPLENERKET